MQHSPNYLQKIFFKKSDIWESALSLYFIISCKLSTSPCRNLKSILSKIQEGNEDVHSELLLNLLFEMVIRGARWKAERTWKQTGKEESDDKSSEDTDPIVFKNS